MAIGLTYSDTVVSYMQKPVTRLMKKRVDALKKVDRHASISRFVAEAVEEKLGIKPGFPTKPQSKEPK